MSFFGELGRSMSETPISHHKPEDDSDSSEKRLPQAVSAQQQKDMEAAYANMRRKMAMQKTKRLKNDKTTRTKLIQ